jgi:hypothetical protein
MGWEEGLDGVGEPLWHWGQCNHHRCLDDGAAKAMSPDCGWSSTTMGR